jgi:hypothetical protein
VNERALAHCWAVAPKTDKLYTIHSVLCTAVMLLNYFFHISPKSLQQNIKHVNNGALHGPVPASSNLNLASVPRYTNFATDRLTR